MGQPVQQITIGDNNDDEDAELQKALALSLKDQPNVTFGQVVDMTNQDDDEDLRQALALSLQQDRQELRESYALSDTRWATGPTTASSQLSSSPENAEADVLLPEQLPSIVLEMGAIDAYYSTAEPFDIKSFHSLMWDDNLTTENDKNRWIGQQIHIRGDESEGVVLESPDDEMARLNLLAKSHVPWGLVQQHGGPCGVLAAVQAEILRYIIWGPLPSAPFLSGDALLEALARAMGTILARAALAEAVEGSSFFDTKSCEGADSGVNDEVEAAVKIVLPCLGSKNMDRPLIWEDFEPWQNSTAANVPGNASGIPPDCISQSSFTTYTITATSADSNGNSVYKRQKISSSDLESKLVSQVSQEKEGQELLLLEEVDILARHVSAFLLQAPAGGFRPIYHFRHAGGVLLLIMSLIASRTPRKLRAEFDEPIGTRLTGQFGHCSQELINLLLTGQAVSNVFDNILKPSGDMICRGIWAKPVAGYLTQLEALHYCSVGSYFKSPRVPVWIIASTSHFSVLFGPKEAIQESANDILLEKCRRAFKSVEGGEENGFVPAESLAFVLAALDYNLDTPKISALSAVLEVTGAGIILWDDFWKATSRLLTGAAIETVLEGQVASSNLPSSHPETAFIGPEQLACPPSPLVRLGGITDAVQSAMYSENIATSTTSSLEATVVTNGPVSIETDEEMARRLAGEWGNEDANSVSAVNGGSPIDIPFDQDVDEAEALNMNTEDSKPPAKEPSKLFDFETYGNTFPLFHYNGLRGGVLTPFRVTRLTPEEAVGASIALSHANSASAQSTDLEEVIRTKWPSCVFNFLGKPPPLID